MQGRWCGNREESVTQDLLALGQPCNGVTDSIRLGQLRAPTEQVFGPAGHRVGTCDIAGTRRAVDDIEGFTRTLFEGLNELLNGNAASGTDIEYLVRVVGRNLIEMLQSSNMSASQIPNVDVVANT